MADYVHSDGVAIAPELPPEPVAPGDDQGESLLRRLPGRARGTDLVVSLD